MGYFCVGLFVFFVLHTTNHKNAKKKHTKHKTNKQPNATKNKKTKKTQYILHDWDMIGPWLGNDWAMIGPWHGPIMAQSWPNHGQIMKNKVWCFWFFLFFLMFCLWFVVWQTKTTDKPTQPYHIIGTWLGHELAMSFHDWAMIGSWLGNDWVMIGPWHVTIMAQSWPQSWPNYEKPIVCF